MSCAAVMAEWSSAGRAGACLLFRWFDVFSRRLAELLADGFSLSLALGAVEAVVANAVLSLDGDVPQGAFDELFGFHGEGALFSVVVVSVAEAYLVVIFAEDAVVFDRAAVDVARQVVGNAFSVPIRPLDADVPGFFCDLAQDALPVVCCPLGGQVEVAFGVGLVEPVQPFAAKFGFDHANGQQEVFFDVSPGAAIPAAAGDEQVDVRVEGLGASPGVEGGEEADFGAEVAFVPEQLLQGFAAGFGQMIGAPGAVVSPQVVQFVRQGEDDVVVVAGEESGLGSIEPVVDIGVLAARAAAMPTAVGLAFGMAVRVAFPFFVAEFVIAAVDDGSGRFALVSGDVVCFQVGFKTSSEDTL